MLMPLLTSSARFLTPDLVARRRPGDWTALFEVPTIVGVVDLVLARLDRGVLFRRGDAAPLHDPRLLQTMRDLQAAGGASNGADLAALGRISHHRMVRTILPRLVETGWVQETRLDRWRARRTLACPAKTIVVVEAKLSSLTKGIAQAHGYALCADRSYVAIGTRPTRRALDRVVASGIGVAAVTCEGADIVLPARQPELRDTHGYALLAEQITAMVRQGQVSGVVRPVFGQMLRGKDDPRYQQESVLAL